MKKVILLLVMLPVIAQGQIITTFAGNGTEGLGLGLYSGPATDAELYEPYGVAVDASGNVYIADAGNSVIRKVNTSGIISTIAGNEIEGYGGDGGPATDAELFAPYGLAIDASGNVYFSDAGNSVIRKINTAGIISTVAGVAYVVGGGTGIYSGDGGPATAAYFNYPYGIAIDVTGNIYIADEGNSVIRKVNTAGIISTIAGNDTIGYSGDGGPATAAELGAPYGLAIDASGNVYVSDGDYNVIRKINAAGIISTIAGVAYVNITGASTYSGDGGPATAAYFSFPYDLAIDAMGNIFIADNLNNVVRKVNTAGIISTYVGNSVLSGYSGDGGPATDAKLDRPVAVAVDVPGNVYVTDFSNNVIRRVSNTAAGVPFGGFTMTENVEIYPNPAMGNFTIEHAAGAEMIISDVVGRLAMLPAMSRTGTMTVKSDKEVVDISTLQSGVYVVQIVDSATGQRITKKIIKE